MSKELELTDIKYYQTNYDLDDKNETVIAYVLKSDPCLTVISLDDKTKNRYCKIVGTNLDLIKNSPTVYISSLDLSLGSSIYFTVSAPWNEQRCNIIAGTEIFECTPIGS